MNENSAALLKIIFCKKVDKKRLTRGHTAFHRHYLSSFAHLAPFEWQVFCRRGWWWFFWNYRVSRRVKCWWCGWGRFRSSWTGHALSRRGQWWCPRVPCQALDRPHLGIKFISHALTFINREGPEQKHWNTCPSLPVEFRKQNNYAKLWHPIRNTWLGEYKNNWVTGRNGRVSAGIFAL